MAEFVNPFESADTGFVNPFENTGIDMPYGWVGRSLSKPLYMYEGGDAYLDLVDRNSDSRRGILEEFTDAESKDVPFVGGFVEIPRLFGVAKTAKALSNGEGVTDQQLLDLNMYLAEQRRKSGASWAAKTLDTIQGSVALSAEIGATAILSGLLAPEPATTAAGGAIATQTAGKLAATKAARRATQAFVRKALGRKASKIAAKAMEGSLKSNVLHNTLAKAARVNVRKAVSKRVGNKAVGRYLGKVAEVATNLETRALLNQALHPERTIRAVAERRIRNSITGGDESVAASVAKGIMDMNFEYASEFSGEYFGALARKLLPEKFVKKLGESILFKTAVGPGDDATMNGAWRALKAMGVNGALEEMAEERAGDFMRGLFGVQGEAGLLNAIKQSWPDAEQFSIEAAAFTILPIMASGMNRMAGGITSAEEAEAIALAHGMTPSADVHAFTEAQTLADAQKLVDTIKRNRTPWYNDTGLDFLGKIFGKERRGVLDSIARRNGLNLIRIHDNAVRAENEAAKKENRPADESVGVRAIADVLEVTRKVQSKGIETEADRELFEAGVKDGSIVKHEMGRFFQYLAAPQALSNKAFKDLAQKTGIRHIVELGKTDMTDLEIGTLDAGALAAKDWQSLPAETKQEFSQRWNSKNERYLSDKYDFIKKILSTESSQDFTVHEVLPSVILGTADEIFDASKYYVADFAPVYDQNEEGQDRHLVMFGAMNTTDGKDIYLSTTASEWSIAEDILEAKLKQGIRGMEISPEAQSWMNRKQSELENKGKNRTKAEEAAYRMLGEEQGRFEFFVKSFLLNRLGYEAQADSYTRALFRDMPDTFDSDIIATIGQDLLDAIAVTPLTVERGERHEAVRQLTQERAAGNVAEARRIVASAEGDALINQLSSALDQDMRKAENKQAVQDILEEMDRAGVTFSLESAYGMENEFADLKRAVEEGTDEAIARAAKHFLLRLPDREERTAREEIPLAEDDRLRTRTGEVLEERVTGERRLRADRAAPYPTPEFAERVIPFRKKGEFPTRRYGRAGARTVVQPEKRTRAGQELPAARTSPSKPFTPTQLRTDIDPAELEAEMDNAAEKEFVAQQFGEDGPTTDEVKVPVGEVSADEAGAEKEPRAYWRMDPLRKDQDLARQITAIVPTGSGTMLRLANDLKENYARQSEVIDAVYIPSKNVYKNRTQWLRRIRKATWETQDGATAIGPLQWDPRSVPHLASTRSALRDPAADVEGAILVLDYGENTMEYYTGLPMQRAMHLAISGNYPLGHAYPVWSWAESEGVRKGILEMDVDEILGEIDETPGKVYDFAEATQPQVWRSAVFPISSQRLESIAGNQAGIDKLANEIHDWMRRNRIRRIMLGGLDQVKQTGSYRTRDGKVEFQGEEVVNPAWASPFSRAIKKAISIETTKRRQDEATAQPIEVTEAETRELERSLKEGTFSLEQIVRNVDQNFDQLESVPQETYSLIASGEIPLMFHVTDAVIEGGFDPSFIGGVRGVGEGATSFGWGFYFSDKPDVRTSYISQFLSRSGRANVYAARLKGKETFKFLDWDKPLSREEQEEFGMKATELHEPTGFELYDAIVFAIRNLSFLVEFNFKLYFSEVKDLAFTEDPSITDIQKNASMFLLSKGYDGIRYEAGGSRRGDRKGKDFDYVIFDPSVIDLRFAAPVEAPSVTREISQAPDPRAEDEAITSTELRERFERRPITFSLEEMDVGTEVPGIDFTAPESIAQELGVRFEGIQETLPQQPNLWFFTDIEHSGSTFAVPEGATLEDTLARRTKLREAFGDETFSLTPDYIYKRILAFNNNRLSTEDARTAKSLVKRLYQGDHRALSTLLRRESTWLSQEDKDNMAPIMTAINEFAMTEPVEETTAEEPPTPETDTFDFDRENDTASLEMMESIFDVQSPVFMSGDVGLHRLLIEADRKRRAEVQVAQSKVDNWRKSIGLLEPDKNLPEGHREKAEQVLESVGAQLDGSERIPIGAVESDWRKHGDTWARKIDVTWNNKTPEQIAQEWDRYIADNNLDMPTTADLYNDMRAEFNAAREAANESLKQLTEEEWIRFLEDYISHYYHTPDPRAMQKIKEDARQSKKRRIDTYEKAAEKHALIPITMDAAKLYQMWNRSVWAAQRNKSLLSMASLLRDADGSPAVIPIRAEEMSGGVNPVIEDKVLRQAGKQLAEYLGVDYNESADPAAEIRRIAGGMDLQKEGYVRMDSPYTQSISYFLVKDGTTHDIMKKVMNHGVIDNTFMRGLERFNAWSKFMMLSFSAFHPLALLESLVAIHGLSWDNPAFHQLRTKNKLAELARTMRTNPEIWEEAVRAGLMVDVGNPDIKLGIIEQDIKRAMDALDRIAGRNQGLKKYVASTAKGAVRGLQKYKHGVDKWLWHTFHPAIKMQSYQFVYNKWLEQNPNALEEEKASAREDVARLVNDAFGGQDWNEYIWATPRARQMLHAVMFAPDWTISAANIAGATRLPGIGGKFHASGISPIAKDAMLRRYWPAMTAIVLMGLPNLVQALIYRAFGDPDEGDEPFTFLNETGKETHIDLTPMLRRLPGYQGGDSAKRRVYMRWGKQAYEVFDGWYKNPLDMLLRKSSSAFRFAFEQATGSTTSGWDLPFKGEGLAGFVTSPEGFMGSRVGTTAQKFVPISVSAMAQGKPTAFVAPVSRGVTKGGVIYSMRKAIESYVDSTSLPKHLRHGDPQQIIAELVNAAEVNGIDPKQAFKQAKAQALGKHYLAFFRALNEGRHAELEESAEKLAILGRGLEAIDANMKRRFEAFGRDYDPTLKDRVAEAVRSTTE